MGVNKRYAVKNNATSECHKVTKKYLFQAIGREVYLIRKSRGLSGKELADKLGVSQQQVSRYERGVCRIDVYTLILLLNKVGEPLDSFFHNVSIRLKEYSPKTYDDYRALFFSVLTLQNEKCDLIRIESCNKKTN